MSSDCGSITVRLGGQDREVTTANGVFSPDHIDTGHRGAAALTRRHPRATGDLLDLGCGWGPIALHLALESPGATVWAVDVNERALELVRRNAAELGLDERQRRAAGGVPDGIEFTHHLVEPADPGRQGRAALDAAEVAPAARARRRTAWLVVQRNLGSDSLQRWLETEFADRLVVAREAISKGFRVLKVSRGA